MSHQGLHGTQLEDEQRAKQAQSGTALRVEIEARRAGRTRNARAKHGSHVCHEYGRSSAHYCGTSMAKHIQGARSSEAETTQAIVSAAQPPVMSAYSPPPRHDRRTNASSPFSSPERLVWCLGNRGWRRPHSGPSRRVSTPSSRTCGPRKIKPALIT